MIKPDPRFAARYEASFVANVKRGGIPNENVKPLRDLIEQNLRRVVYSQTAYSIGSELAFRIFPELRHPDEFKQIQAYFDSLETKTTMDGSPIFRRPKLESGR